LSTPAQGVTIHHRKQADSITLLPILVDDKAHMRISKSQDKLVVGALVAEAGKRVDGYLKIGVMPDD